MLVDRPDAIAAHVADNGEGCDGCLGNGGREARQRPKGLTQAQTEWLAHSRMNAMDRENGRPVSKAHTEPFGGGSAYRHFRFFAMLGLIYGIIASSVLSTSPAAITVVKYVVPVVAIVGVVTGAWYGFFFNISNHSTGGRLLCGTIGGIGAAAVGTLVVSLVMTVVGVVAGFALGWIVGSFLNFKGREGIPWIGAGVGAVAQAGWTNPAAAMQAAALGGVIGTIAGPMFLLLCGGLAHAVVRKTGPPRYPFYG